MYMQEEKNNQTSRVRKQSFIGKVRITIAAITLTGSIVMVVGGASGGEILDFGRGLAMLSVGIMQPEKEVQALNDRLHFDPFLGKGTLAVSEIFYNSPSRCAVADMAAISVDRRLTDGETWEMALEEIRALPSVKKYNAEVSMYKYDRPSWTELTYPTECYFPTWVIPEDHPATKAMVQSYSGMFGVPVVDKWTFSTNGVSVMGRFGIPCIGFGPGKEAQAHAPNEITWKADLVKCAAVYAALPTLYCGQKSQQGDNKLL